MRRKNVQSMSKYPTHSVLQVFGSLEKAIRDKDRASSANKTSSKQKCHVYKVVEECHKQACFTTKKDIVSMATDACP